MSYDGISVKRQLKGIKHKPLKPDEERELILKAVKGDAEARGLLIEANQRFIVRMALTFRNQGFSVADLIQEGNLGLIEAIDRFDPDKNCRLVSYAAWWIRLYMQRAIEQKSRTVTIPINKVGILKKIKNFEYGFIKSNGRKPTYKEIAKSIGMDEAKVQYIYNLSTTTLSIHVEDEEGQTIEDRLEVDDADPLRHKLWIDELTKSVSKALGILTQKEQEVLRCRFGLDEDDPVSLRKAGRKLGLSAEGVRQIQSQALAKLRDPELECGLRAFVQAV
ncbi:MAG: RNA polymerase sigma factor RpoD/SigA [Candidatus Omnitrophota bacterium]